MRARSGLHGSSRSSHLHIRQIKVVGGTELHPAIVWATPRHEVSNPGRSRLSLHMGISEDAVHYYETGNDKQLWELAEAAWPKSAADLTQEVAELCFFARSAYIRREQWDDGALWSARALIASVVTKSERTACRLLLGKFFRATARGQHRIARSILREMQKLVDVTDPEEPFCRLYNEKLAYSYLVDQRYSEAIEHYQQALAGAVKGNDKRGILKVRGGLTLAMTLANRASEPENGPSEQFKFIAEAAGRHGYRDVEEAAQSNLRWLSGEEHSWTAFEVL